MNDFSAETKPKEIEAFIEDDQKYLEQLYEDQSKHPESKETQAEIARVNQRLYKNVQEKYGIHPEKDSAGETQGEPAAPLTPKGIAAVQGQDTSAEAEEGG